MIIVATKELTIRVFFINLIKKLIASNIKIVIVCNDAKKLQKFFNKRELALLVFEETNFPISIKEILNIYKLFRLLFFLNKIFSKYKKINIIYTHTPIASHISRLASLFLKKKIIYHVHGLRFHKNGNI